MQGHGKWDFFIPQTVVQLCRAVVLVGCCFSALTVVIAHGAH